MQDIINLSRMYKPKASCFLYLQGFQKFKWEPLVVEFQNLILLKIHCSKNQVQMGFQVINFVLKYYFFSKIDSLKINFLFISDLNVINLFFVKPFFIKYLYL
jgi:hypothetical protein